MNELRNFALNVLYAWDGEYDPTFKNVWQSYKKLTGSKIQYDTFRSMIADAWDAGYLKLGGHWGEYTLIPKEDTIELVGHGYKGKSTFWVRLVEVKATITKLAKQVDDEAFGYVNQNIADAFIRHQIHLLRVAGGLRNEMADLLDKSEKDIAEQIRRRLADGRATLGTRRLQQLEQYVALLRRNAWTEVRKKLDEDIKELAKTEPKFIAGVIQSATPVALTLNLPQANTLVSLVRNNPFEGRILRDWAKDIAEQDVNRILGQIRIGMVNGESADQIARRVVGSAQLKGTDGVTEITRRNAASIARTAVMALSHMAREEFYEENADLFEKEKFVATLDGRTTPVCRANDGKTFDRGTGPRPPLHWNCRSIRVPYFVDGALGDRPARNFTQKKLVRDFAEENGLGSINDRDDLPRGYKKAFDEFARQRMRALTSVVPATENFTSFLKRQTKDVQDDILGPTRARLFRTGKLSMDSFVDKSGRTYTLRDLASKYRAIFAEAGLEPEDYL